MNLTIASMFLGISLCAQVVVDPPVKSWITNAWRDDGQVLLIPPEPQHPKAPATLVQNSAWNSTRGVGKTRRLPDAPGQQRRQGLVAPKFFVLQAPQGIPYSVCKEIVPSSDPRRLPQQDMKIEVFQFDVNRWRWVEKPWATLMFTEHFIPHLLSKDYMLGVATDPTTFKKDGKYYPFAIFRRSSSGMFVLDHYEDAGLDLPAIQGSGKWEYPFLASLWIQSRPVWAGDNTILSPGNGMFWHFTAKGAFKGTIKLFGCLSEKNLHDGSIWNGTVLEQQPNQDGDLIVSSLAEDAVLKGAAMMTVPLATEEPDATEDPEASEGPDGERARAAEMTMEQNLDAICRLWPTVQWYKVKIGQHEVTRIPAPKNIPSLVMNSFEYRTFTWAFQPDGNIRMFQ